MPEAPSGQSCELLIGGRDPHDLLEQVVEVDDTLAMLELRVGGQQFAIATGRNRTAPTGSPARLVEAIRRHHAGAGPVDVSSDLERFARQPQLRDALAQQPHPIRREGRHRLVAGECPVAQQSQGHAVEGTRLDAVANVESPESAL